MTAALRRADVGRRFGLERASSTASMCLQVPSVLDLKSGQVQALSPTSNPRMVTVYWPPVIGIGDAVVPK